MLFTPAVDVHTAAPAAGVGRGYSRFAAESVHRLRFTGELGK